jgi:hypothetical protein
MRQEIRFSVLTGAEQGEIVGNLVIDIGDVSEDVEPYTVVWYTLDSGRLTEMLTAAGATPEQVETALFTLDAIAGTQNDVEDDPDEDVDYWRPLLVKILTNHQRLWPDNPERDGCSCGQLRIGDSFAEHIADVYEMEARS